MNKNFKNFVINNFLIISITLLGLIYLYLEYPNNILEQRGGSTDLWDYPSNTPFMFKYRFGFVALPFLLLGLCIYYLYYVNVIVPSYTIWDLGYDFFSNFQKQYNIAVANPNIGIKEINYKYPVSDSMKKKEPDLASFFNIIQLTQNPLSSLYTKAQYFCETARPCNCCLSDLYVTYFWKSCTDAKSCKDPGYLAMCKPNNK